MVYEIYVISNSEMFGQGLNAVASFCSSEGFRNATWVGAALGIIMTAFAYVKQHDVLLFMKWLAVYCFVFNVMLGATTSVAIINTSDQTVPGLIVDNVPLGVALPAYLVTSIGYGFSSDLETVFSMPSDLQYSRTGMLFGSNLFRLSLASQIDDPKIMSQMNSYIRSCVVGDILINHKYTFDQLLHSKDIWGLISSKPSPIRGMFVSGKFKTCAEATRDIDLELNDYVNNKAPNVLARFIPSGHPYAASAINSMLTSTYNFFKETGDSAAQILRQNIAINAFRSGIKSYAVETGSIAGMTNIANSTAMSNTRMAWATSRHLGIQTLPLMQVVLLLLLICIFPLVAVLSLIPNLGISVYKNYLYSLLWLETWPIMYTVLNMAMTFYMKSGSVDDVTLSNINLLAQEHSDIAGIAGYLVLAIPFLSLGIVKGMAFTFNNAAQYLGGMMHSIAQSSASSAAMGNYSLGNISTDNATANNLSANKHDTNFTSLHGMNTGQLGNGATVTATSMGADVYHTGSGMSQLAVGENVAQSSVASLSQQVDRSISSALQHNTQFLDSKGHHEGLGTSGSMGVSSNVDHAMSTIHNLTQSLSDKEHVSTTESFKRLSEISGTASLSASGELGFSVFGNGGNIGLRAEGNIRGQTTSSHDGSYVNGSDSNVSSSDAHDFRQAVNTIKNYSVSHSISRQNTNAENLAIQTGADLTAMTRSASSAQFIQNHSEAINTNFSQAFAAYVEKNHPTNASAILSATGDSPMLTKQQELADKFIQTHAAQLASRYENDRKSVLADASGTSYATENYNAHQGSILASAKNVGINKKDPSALDSQIQKGLSVNNAGVQHGNVNIKSKENDLSDKVRGDISKGRIYASKGVTEHVVG